MLRLNVRFLILTVVALVLGVGVAGGIIYWGNRPEQLYASADAYYKKGEEALKREDWNGARSNFQAADEKLKILLDPKKAPGHSHGALLRFKTLSGLVTLAKRDEEASKNTAPDRPSVQLGQEAIKYLVLAAQDKNYWEPQALLLDISMRNDDYVTAEDFATQVLKLKDEAPADYPNKNAYILGAYFVLAHRALYAPRPQAEVAMEYIKESNAIQTPGAGTKVSDPRWRIYHLQVMATRALRDRAKETRLRPGQPAANQPDYDKLLKAEINEGVNRLRSEVKEVVKDKDKNVELSPLAQLYKTDARGVFEFLQIALADASTPRDVTERALVAIDVVDKMTAPGAGTFAQKEGVNFLSHLPAELDRNPIKPATDSAALLQSRLKEVSDRLVKEGVPIGADAYVRLARGARARGEFANAESLARKALELATQAKVSADNPLLLDINAELAWLQLVQGRPSDAEKYLGVLRDNKRSASVAALISGLAAVLDGRLEQAVRDLNLANENPQIDRQFKSHVGLVRAYMGLGRYREALQQLDTIKQYVQRLSAAPDKMSAEDRYFATQLMPNQDALELAQIRCYVGMGNMAEAMKLRQQLRDKPSEVQAIVTILDAEIAAARANLRNGKTDQAEKILEAARTQLTEAQKVYRDDTALTMAAVKLILAQPDRNYGVMGSAVLDCATIPASLGSCLLGNLAMEAGLNWHITQAEQVLAAHVFKKRDEPKLSAGLAWVQWLRATGRLSQASNYLAAMEVQFPEVKRGLLVQRAQLALAQGQTEEVGKVKEAFGGTDSGDLLSDTMQIYFLAAEGGNKSIQAQVAAALSRHEASGQLHLWQGQLAQTQGSYKEAIAAYERAMQFVQYRSAAVQGLYASLKGMANKEGAEAAFKEVAQLRNRYPREGVVLLAYAEIAGLMDEIGGKDGVIAALTDLKKVMSDARQAAQGHLQAARVWEGIGRPDLAEEEVLAALRIAPDDITSRILAGRLAVASEKWEAALQRAEEVSKQRPDLVDPLLWEASAYQAQGKYSEARAVYQKIIGSFPNVSGAWLGLALVEEQAGHYAQALDAVREFRKLAPTDINGVRTEVRLLVREGKLDDARQLGERVLAETMARFRENQQADEKRPARTDEERQARAERWKDGGVALEMQVLNTVGNGFLEAKAFDQATEWYNRSLVLADQRTTDKAKKESKALEELLLADMVMQRAMKEAKDSPARKQQMAKAIEMYRKVLDALPGNVIAANNIAWLLAMEENRPEEAIPLVEELRKGRYSHKLISGDRINLSILDTLGAVYLKGKQPEKAQALFLQAVERYRNEPRVYLYLGKAYLAQGDKPRALASLNKAVTLADEQLKVLPKGERKDKLQELLNEATKAQEKARQ